jgi:diamine N-acetyltransferase
MPTVTLREVTADTVQDICRLKVSPAQEKFVAPNAVSIAEAYFAPYAWFRAIYADETPVGFVMLAIQPNDVEYPYFIWRYMIDAHHQGKGYGEAAMHQVIDFVRTQPNAQALFLSYVQAPGGPDGFYRRIGFVDTGVMLDGEHVMRLDLLALSAP